MSSAHASGAMANNSTSAMTFAATTVCSAFGLTVTATSWSILVSVHTMTRVPRLSAATESAATTLFLSAGWYVALLVPTLVFKYVYLAALSGDGSSKLSELAASVNRAPIWCVHVHDIAPADFLDVFWLVAGLWLIGRALVKIPVVAVACASVFVMLVVGGAHIIAIREMGAPLTLDSVRITKAWLADHPALIPQFLL